MEEYNTIEATFVFSLDNMSANMIEAKVSELNRQFGSLSRITEVDRFLKASKAFNDMMVKVYKTVNEAVEADLRLK